MIEDVIGTYELSSCYNVTIDCRAADMIATVRTNKIFNGKIYAKDNPNSCVVDVENAIEFDIKMVIFELIGRRKYFINFSLHTMHYYYEN